MVRFLVSTEDPQSLLAVVGPRAIWRLVDLLYSFRDDLDGFEPNTTSASLRLNLSLLLALQSLSDLPHADLVRPPQLAAAFQEVVDLVLRIFGKATRAGAGTASSPDLVSDLQNYKTVPIVMKFLASVPHVDPGSWQGMGQTWWRVLSAGLQLISTLAIHHHSLAHSFVECDGLHMIVDRRLLAVELVDADPVCAHIVVDALLIVSQLSRLSKEYYPILQRMECCSDLRKLLACSNANVRAKTCNAIGNMARHSDAFYGAIQASGCLANLIPVCADVDSSCRKFASFAVGNAAFHSAMLYPHLAASMPLLQRLLEDQDEKTRANAAGAIGNLVRNSDFLCAMAIQDGALAGLVRLVRSRCCSEDTGEIWKSPVDTASIERLCGDTSIKIALFSLGNLAVHDECRAELLTPVLRIGELCRFLLNVTSPDDVVHKYAQRLLQKLGS
jgi:hypothetical protein